MVEGEQLGSYTLSSCIGRGGMGEVWHARHTHLGRPAAIKVIRPRLLVPEGSDELLVRFKREAKATSTLRSPHTVEVYDFGITDEGLFYYVMELLEGYSLQAMVDRWGPLPPGRVISLLAQACESLEEAHRAGLVHRDIKPGNLFVCQQVGTNPDFVKVLDFGLVKLDDDAGDASRLTHTDATQGTPAFMPPEVVYGSAHFDRRSDIYMLGCVAYWLLTARLVFDSGTNAAMIQAHIHDLPTPPSTVTPVPGGLEAAVMRCLAKDPEDRPHSAADLRETLRACVEKGAWTDDQARQWWGDHPAEPHGAAETGAGFLSVPTWSFPGVSSSDSVPGTTSTRLKAAVGGAAGVFLILLVAALFFLQSDPAPPSCALATVQAIEADAGCAWSMQGARPGQAYQLLRTCGEGALGLAVAKQAGILHGLGTWHSCDGAAHARPLDQAEAEALVAGFEVQVREHLTAEACVRARSTLAELTSVSAARAEALSEAVAGCGVKASAPEPARPIRVCYFEDSDTLLPQGVRCCETGDAAPRRILAAFGCDRGSMCLRWGKACRR